jgi:hypothetical protein
MRALYIRICELRASICAELDRGNQGDTTTLLQLLANANVLAVITGRYFEQEESIDSIPASIDESNPQLRGQQHDPELDLL